MRLLGKFKRKYGLAGIAIFLGLFAAFFILELTVRLALPKALWEFKDATDDWTIDSRIGWVQKGNLDVIARNDTGHWISFKTNADGLQPSNARPAKLSGTIRVLMIGDSTVVGRAVAEEDRVHRQLEQRLHSIGIRAEVLNAGVQGFSTDQELLLLEKLGPAYRPDIIILAVCTNDFAQNGSGSANGLSKPHFERESSGELRYIPPQQQDRIRRFGRGLTAWLQYSALYRAIQPAIFGVRAALGNWRERNMLGLADELYYSSEVLNNVDWAMFEALLVRMHRLSATLGAKFYVYMHPAIDEVWNPYIENSIRRAGIPPGNYDRYAVEKKIAGIASRYDISFIPQIDAFLRRSPDGPFHLLPRDSHCNEVCYRITSQIIAGNIFPGNSAWR